MQNMIEPWALSKEEVFQTLETPEAGLTDEDVQKRLKIHGNNVFQNNDKINPVSIFLKQFISPLIFLLIGAAILTSILGEWVNTYVIAFAILLNVFLGFYNEYNAEDTLSKLSTYIKDRSKVIRFGVEQEIDSSLIVPGDIVKLSYGSRIPADAYIFEINDFRTDEAILTGESLPVIKTNNLSLISASVSDRKNIAHAGTLVVGGYAKAIVYTTGSNTEIGKIADIVAGTKRVQTPLQKGIGNLSWFIFVVVIVIVVGILFLGILRGESLTQMLVLGAAVAVGAVPEALPITLTVILSIGALRIAQKKGVIRKLTAAETLGSTTLIMTDKTGTLTLAQMKLVGIHTKSDIFNTILDNEHKVLSHEHKKILEDALLCVDVVVQKQTEAQNKWEFIGKPFEVNIAKAAEEHKIPLDNILNNTSHIVLPFNSTNKFSVSKKEDEYIVMGAPDILLKKSNLSKEDFLKFEEWIEKTSNEGKRLIGIASMPKNKNANFDIEDIKDLEFLGMLVFYDPIRPEVPKAIATIKEHGVKIVLVTGDLPGTAVSIANTLGFDVLPDEVITGADLRVMSDEELLPILSKIKIFARVTPEDKLRIGKLFQKNGEVVAMTGDGVNDAPALKAMDIGISLGSGSDVAKSAADLVLLDDNFHTISLAIDEGHRILANVRKTVVYLLSNSLDEVFVIGGALLFTLPLPLTPLQIIWVNLFTGSLPALAFAYEENMDKRKFSKKESKVVFTPEVKIITFGIGVFSSLLLFCLYYLLYSNIANLAEARSVFFVCFASYILAVSFSFRSLYKPIFSYNIFSNKKLNYSIIIAVVILVLTMSVPAIRHLFDLAPLPLYSLPIIFIWLVINVALVEFAKFVLSKKDKLISFFNYTKFKTLKTK